MPGDSSPRRWDVLRRFARPGTEKSLLARAIGVGDVRAMPEHRLALAAAIDEIVVTTAFTCTKMRPDGFGGSVMLITVDAIRYRSTTDILEEFRIEAAKAAAARQVPSSTDNR